MFLLSLQTGLIDMEMPHRLGAMSVILFIVAASLFQVLLLETLICFEREGDTDCFYLFSNTYS